MNVSYETPKWGFQVYYGMSIITLPLYLIILVCLLRLRHVSKVYTTTFYSLLLQHSIADIASMLGYIALIPAREISTIRKFYFEYQEYYIAAATYNIIYVTLYIRCSGILILSLQRCLVIAYPHCLLTHKVQTVENWKIILIYWITPNILNIVVVMDVDVHFNNVNDMTLIVSSDVTQKNTLMALYVVSFICITSSIAYGALFLFIRKNSVRISKFLLREIRFALQVFVLLLAFFAILVVYGFLNYFSNAHMTREVVYVRGIYPMANGFLSYINPYCILLLNKDLGRQVIKSLKCESGNVSEVQVSAITTISARQQTRNNTMECTEMVRI